MYMPIPPSAASQTAQFFITAQFWAISLIINGYVGSFASHYFPKLRKNFPLLLTSAQSEK